MDCVSCVGVDLNTASMALLTHVAGMTKPLARRLLDYRKEKGVFRDCPPTKGTLQ